MIRFTQRGDFNKTVKALKSMQKLNLRPILERYAIEGVTALTGATPQDSGRTANAWNYEIEITSSGFKIHWTNTNMVDGIPVAILLQYGHATRSGSFVQGRDFINPAIRPIFDRISENIWKEVSSI